MNSTDKKIILKKSFPYEQIFFLLILYEKLIVALIPT